MRSILLSLVTVLLTVAPAAGQNPRVIAFGDSITTGLGDTGVTCPTSSFGGYPQRLRARLAGRGVTADVINRGICGETTVGAMSRVDSVLAEGGDVFVLMEGTNDITNPYISLDTIRFNLNELSRLAFEAGFEPVLASVIPRRSDCGTNVETAALASMLAEDSTTLDYAFANPYAAFINLPDLFDTYYNDPWHPLPEGYQLLADEFVDPTLRAIERSGLPRECVEDARTLCLNQSRFAITVSWEKPDGETGVGTAIPRTPDTGSFWFFNENNIELVIKVLDCRERNGHFWIFYGSLSNVGFTITVVDTITRKVRRYENPQGNFASVGDPQAFEVPPDEPTPDGVVASVPAVPDDWVAVPLVASPTISVAKGEPDEACVEDDQHLCLNDNRFRVSVTWRDFLGNTGVGTAIPRTRDTGNFWFFRDANIELIVKVLDGTINNDHFWVFFGALSNVEYTMTVEDTVTGAVKTYLNPLETFASIGDTLAFPVEPSP